jgi:hypothetical protein
MDKEMREILVEKVKLLRKRLENLEASTPLEIKDHMRAIWFNGRIFALENILMEF